MVDVQARSIESASSKDARFRVSGMGGAPAFCGFTRSSLLTLKLSASCAIPQITLISAKGFPKYAKRFMFFHFVSKQVTLAGSRDCAETGLGVISGSHEGHAQVYPGEARGGRPENEVRLLGGSRM